MAVTQGVINNTFCKLIPYPNGNIFTEKGFEVLANWSEQQEWWNEFLFRFVRDHVVECQL